MIVVWGEKLYGKVDHVPGLFYVATRFYYLQYLPLIPVGSVLVIDGTEKGGNVQGCRIKLSGKSILFAWLRAALIVAGIVMVFGALVQLGKRKDTVTGVGLLLSAVGMWVLCWLSYRFSRAGAARALRLASEAGIPPEVVARAFVANGFRPPDPQDSAPEVRADDR